MDLSQFSEPISQDSRFKSEPPANVCLTREQIQKFHTQGFVVGNGILSAETVSELRGELVSLMSVRHPGQSLWHEFHLNEADSSDDILFHALGAWRISPAFHDLLWESSVTVPATQLLGGDVRFWHDQLFCKPAWKGGTVAWHQDYSYWTRTKPMAHLTCWIALEDACVENGCVHYIPGSHRWDLLPITGLAGDMKAIEDVLSETQFAAMGEAVPVQLKPGEMVFHHPLTVHGSFHNRTDKSRHGTVINMIADGVKSDSDKPLLKGIPVVKRGEILQGRFFPLLRKCTESFGVSQDNLDNRIG